MPGGTWLALHPSTFQSSFYFPLFVWGPHWRKKILLGLCTNLAKWNNSHLFYPFTLMSFVWTYTAVWPWMDECNTIRTMLPKKGERPGKMSSMSSSSLRDKQSSLRWCDVSNGIIQRFLHPIICRVSTYI